MTARELLKWCANDYANQAEALEMTGRHVRAKACRDIAVQLFNAAREFCDARAATETMAQHARRVIS